MDPEDDSRQTATNVSDETQVSKDGHASSKFADGEIAWDPRGLEAAEDPSTVFEDVEHGHDSNRQTLEAADGRRRGQREIALSKEQRGWRRVVRNFTPS